MAVPAGSFDALCRDRLVLVKLTYIRPPLTQAGSIGLRLG